MTTGAVPPHATEFEVATRHIVMERDLNPVGHLFGGAMLAWLDEGAALYLQEKIGYRDFVTAGMDNVNFVAPGHHGESIQILCRVARTGRSSVTVEAKAVGYDVERGAVREIITCRITYVCLKNERPYPYFQSEEYRRWIETRYPVQSAPADGRTAG